MGGAQNRDFGLASVQVQRVRPEKNERRFYVMIVTLDLFGGAILMRNSSRIETGGQLRLDVCVDIVAAGAALNYLARRKRRRGYIEL